MSTTATVIIVAYAISKAMAQRLDLVALYGGITSGAGTINLPVPPNPRGVLAALNAVLPGNVLGAAANGTAQTAATYFGEVLDTIYTRSVTATRNLQVLS